jgi:hypothetical protein
MAVNPDPKPGRWILPLVILGMVAFTYFFVRELPEASTQTTISSSPGTTVPGATDGTGGESPSTTTAPADPAVQAFLTEIDSINQALQAQRTELVTVNTAFNQDPREVEYDDAVTRFTAVQTATAELAGRQAALTPPAALQANHDALLASINLASQSATQALEGLQSTDTGDQRNSAVQAFDTASADYDTEVTNTNNVATGG